LLAISSSLKTCAPPKKSSEQERIQKPHACQPQHQRRRGGEKQQEGNVVEIPVPDGSSVYEDIQV